jgi:thioredoxin-related protein
MKLQLQIYTRKNCCLCEEMKKVIRAAKAPFPITLEEIDVDSFAELQLLYGDKVPVLFINGRKAFKYRVTARELQERFKKEKSRD